MTTDDVIAPDDRVRMLRGKGVSDKGYEGNWRKWSTLLLKRWVAEVSS